MELRQRENFFENGEIFLQLAVNLLFLNQIPIKITPKIITAINYCRHTQTHGHARTHKGTHRYAQTHADTHSYFHYVLKICFFVPQAKAIEILNGMSDTIELSDTQTLIEAATTSLSSKVCLCCCHWQGCMLSPPRAGQSSVPSSFPE